MSFSPVLFLSKHHSHHSKVSGYEQLAYRWPGAKEILKYPEYRGSKYRTWNFVNHKLNQIWAKCLTKYVCHMVISKRINIVHVLYGDTILPLHDLPPQCKLVATIHQPVSHLTRSRNRIERLRNQLKNVDLCVTVSTEQATFIRSFFPNIQVEFVPHGVDTHFFSPQYECRQRVVLIVHGWYRDMEIGAGVINKLLQIDGECKIRIAGAWQNDLGFNDNRVQILPRLTDEQLRDEYAKCAIVFLPLKEATANNALLESLSCGTPVMAPSIGGVVDYINNSELLYDPGTDQSDIALRIKEALDVVLTSGVSPIWRNQGIKFAWSNIIQSTNNLYSQL